MKSKYLMIGAAVCAALFLFSGIMLCRQYADGKQATEAFEQVAALVETKPLPELTSPPVISPAPSTAGTGKMTRCRPSRCWPTRRSSPVREAAS